MEMYNSNKKPKRTDRPRNKKFFLWNDFILPPSFLRLSIFLWVRDQSTENILGCQLFRRPSPNRIGFASEGLDGARQCPRSKTDAEAWSISSITAEDYLEGKNQDKIQLTMLMKIEPTTAPQKPLTWNPPTRAATSQSIKPLITRRKRPRVNTVRGRVSKTEMGRMRALTIPRRRAAIKAAPKLST